MIRICFLIFAAVSLISCGSKDEIPETILKPDKMQAVLLDVIKAQAFTDQYIKKDSTKNAEKENLKMQQEIFNIHHVSKEEFYKSYDYYKTHTALFNQMLDSITVQDERNKKTKKIKPVQADSL